MHVAISPLTSTNNRYIEITVECLRRTGADVYEFYPIFKKPDLFSRTDVIILNWFERLGHKPVRRLRKMICKMLLILWMKLFRKKIVFVFHNKVSHEESKKRMSFFFMRYLCRRADRIVILSRGSADVLAQYICPTDIAKKVRFIAHPNYIGAYPEPKAAAREATGNQAHKLKLLFIGAVRPYKNVELILDAARHFIGRPVTFTIAGRPKSPEYRCELEGMASGLTNVELQLRFIDDSELVGIIRASDALVLPYDQKSSLNSGTALLAFSNRKTVVCPLIETLKDFPGELCYSYNYENPGEHREKLFAQIEELLCDYERDGAILERKGNALYDLVAEFNSKEYITARYGELLAELG